MSTEQNKTSNINKALFVNLVNMFMATAFQALGKMANPGTGKAEVNLEAAQLWIDMLSMLEAKMKGNLDPDEAKFIATVLTDLRMNYVETAEAEAKTPAGTPDTKAPAAEKPDSGQPKAEPPKDPKFQKKYGE
jgi:hypothetical protein